MGSVLRHIAIRAADIERSRLFYESILGLSFVGFRPSGSGSMDLSDGTLNMTLLPYDGPARASLPEPTEFIHLGFIVEDLDAAFDKCVANGFEVLRDNVKERNEPDARPTVSFKVSDPDGNVIDVTRRKDEWRGVKV
ncbi:MAG: VOC family protein [Candidatus Latescibacteria bacterium]|nr:VOC family protein [Candidatus Latescibacterota bacterium]